MKRLSILVIILGVAVGSSAHAAAPHDVCVGAAFGVPTRPGPPAWATWVNGSADLNTDLDDPRWNQATAKAFVTGTATAPLHVRALWSPDSTGQEYLYLSLVSDLDPNATTPRDVFVGFRRAHSSPSVDSGSVGYIFQFHLARGGPIETAVTPKYCGDYFKHECKDGDAASFGDWWRLFQDPDLPPDAAKKCTATDGSQINGHQYIPMNGSSTTIPTYLVRPFTWQATAGDADFVHYWRLGTSRWAIQLRIKIAPSSAGSPPPISAGIEKGSTFWYEVTESATGQYASIGKFPEPITTLKTGVTTSICVSAQSNNDSLFHQELGSHDPSCPTPTTAGCVCPLCDASKFSKLSDVILGSSTSPTDCDRGISIANIGSVFNYDPSTQPPLDTIGLSGEIKAVDLSNHTHPNTIVAQIVNTNPAAGGSVGDIHGTIQARFRLANWGTEQLFTDPTDIGQFSDVRGGGAVCLPTGAPPCTTQTVAAGSQVAIHFNWQLGNDGTLGDSEYCAYGLQPPGGATCDLTTCPKDMSDPTHPRDQVKASTGPCTVAHGKHECMLVELSAPNSDVNFVQASAYNNMDFAQMSTVAREALIDARKLPKAPGQTVQDIFFYVVPRNMPASLPAGSTVTGLIQEAAVARALTVSQPYLADIAHLTKENPERLREIEDNLARQRRNHGQIGVRAAASARDDKRLPPIRQAMLAMPNEDFERVGQLVMLAADPGEGNQPNDALVHEAVAVLGPSEAAQLVPTLEIYPFYKPPNDVVYQPMSSFALFLSHEAVLGGMHYEVDGADKVAENVYRVQIPVGNARRIQIRAQALVGSEVPLPPGMPKWPCAGGCVTCGGAANRNCGLVTMLGNSAPGLIAGVFVVRRRRRKPAKPAA
jgi:hypothetical protein